MRFPRGLEFRAYGLPILEQRRRLFGEAGIVDFDLARDLGLSADVASDTAGIVSGLAAPYNSPTEIGGGKHEDEFTEILLPGAFTKTLRERPRSGDVRALAAHDSAMLLGRTANGTLRLWEEPRGLAFELALPKTDLGYATLRLVHRRDLTGCSWGFAVPEGGDTWKRESGRTVRRISELMLFETSLVAWPAYRDTSVDVGDARAARLASRERLLARQALEQHAARERRLRLVERLARVA